MYDAGEPKPLHPSPGPEPHLPREPFTPLPSKDSVEGISEEAQIASLRQELVGVAKKPHADEREFGYFRLEDLASEYRAKLASAHNADQRRQIQGEWDTKLYEALPAITAADFPEGCGFADDGVYGERMKQQPFVEVLGTLSNDYPNLRLFHVGQVRGPAVSVGQNYFVGDLKSAVDYYTNSLHTFKHPAPVISAVALSEVLTLQRDGVLDVIPGEREREVFVTPHALSQPSEMSPQTIWTNTLLRSSHRFTVNSDQQKGLLGAFSQKAAA